MSLNLAQKDPANVRDLYPDMDERDRETIEFNLRRYVGLVWRIAESRDSASSNLLTETQDPANVTGRSG